MLFVSYSLPRSSTQIYKQKMENKGTYFHQPLKFTGSFMVQITAFVSQNTHSCLCPLITMQTGIILSQMMTIFSLENVRFLVSFPPGVFGLSIYPSK